jgi:hypothetical protein
MNIVYAVKIFVAFMLLLGVARVVAGPGLRAVMSPGDWKVGWRGIAITAFVSAFAVKSGLFLLALALWAPMLAKMFDRDAAGRLLAYALLLPICPPMHLEVQNIGPIGDLFQATPTRVLDIVLLLPEMLRLLGRKDAKGYPSWMVLCDLAFFAYSAYWILHLYGGFSLSVLMRQGFVQLLDTALPYYVVSRACMDPELRRRVLGVLLLAACFIAVVGLAETASGHYFYLQYQWLYHEDWQQGRGLVRGGLLRAQAAYLGPLAMAVFMMFALTAWAVLKPPLKTRAYSLVGVGLFAGMLATVGRGPLLGMGILLVCLALLRFMSGKRFLLVVAAGLVAIVVCWQIGIVDQLIEAMRAPEGSDPTADFNIRYRQELLTTSLELLKQSPWLGVPNFMSYLQDLKQGEGIVDLVNTYLIVALNVGVIGLAMFLLPYLVCLWQLAKQHAAGGFGAGREGPVWMAFGVAMLAVIFTVSPVSIIQPILIWTLALAVAQLAEKNVARVRMPLRGVPA